MYLKQIVFAGLLQIPWSRATLRSGALGPVPDALCASRMNASVTSDRATRYEIAGQPRARSRRVQQRYAQCAGCSVWEKKNFWRTGTPNFALSSRLSVRLSVHRTIGTFDIWDASKRAIIRSWRRNRSVRLAAISADRSTNSGGPYTPFVENATCNRHVHRFCRKDPALLIVGAKSKVLKKWKMFLLYIAAFFGLAPRTRVPHSCWCNMSNKTRYFEQLSWRMNGKIGKQHSRYAWRID